MPPRRQRLRILDIHWKIHLTPLLAVDIERPYVGRLRDLMNHPEIPDCSALRRPDRMLDRLAELLGAAAAEGEQADRLGIDRLERQALADGF
jgi:hypothetical protein